MSIDRARWGVLAVLVACADEPEAEDVDAPSEARSEIPAVHRCGEAGPQATPLPPDLAAGLQRVGGTRLHPDNARTIDGVAFHYEPATALVRGYIHIRAPDDEHAHSVAVIENENEQREIGQHRIDFRVASTPPLAVDVEVERWSCPKDAQLQQTTRAQSLWLSTEAIREHTLGNDELTLELIDLREFPTVYVRSPHYESLVRLTPETRTTLRAHAHVVSIDEVVVGPDTRFDARWESELPPKVHVRATIERASTTTHPERVEASGCGAPSPTPTEIPGQLYASVPVVDDIHLTYDETAITGAFDLRFQPSILDEPGLVEIGYPDLRGVPSRLPYHPESEGPFVFRHERSLLRLDPDADNDVHARLVRLACDAEVRLASLSQPVYVWLSTIGHHEVGVGDPPRVLASLDPHMASPKLAASAGSYVRYVRSVEPAAVGDAFTIPDALVEIVDVVSTGSTRFEADRWHSTATIPAIHVQLRLSPNPYVGRDNIAG